MRLMTWNVLVLFTVFVPLALCGNNDKSCGELMKLVKIVNYDEGDQTSYDYTCIDMYESSVVEVVGQKEYHWPFNYPVDNITAKAVVKNDTHPQAYISALQAKAACLLAGKHLCTLNEWLSACRGPQNYTYPYGNTYEKGYCNEGRATNPVNDLYGPHANFNWTEMNDPRLDKLPHTVSRGGAYERCVSSYGVYDMSGSLDEWVDHLNPNNKGTFKGGYFVDAKINGPGCLYKTVAHQESYHDYSLGFRCCAPPNKET